MPAGPHEPRALPKNWAEPGEAHATVHATERKPGWEAADAGAGPVFVVDAAPFVFGTFVWGLGSFPRLVVRAASGRPRFHVRGAWNAVTRQRITVTTTTVVHTATRSALLRKSAAVGWIGPITLVLDPARDQPNAAVKAVAEQLVVSGISFQSFVT